MAAPAPGPYRYWAFISYSHADEKHARWLHRGLERFRGHRKLVGSVGRSGELVPDRVYPVFRDRDELEGASDLGQRINDALVQSRTLIVICSPRSATSRYVEQEIRHFKSLGRENRVFALIVDGEPHAADHPESAAQECFPVALKQRFDARGQATGEPAEPLAADLRPGKDEPRDAMLKILAGILGLAYDDLRQRDAQHRLRVRTVWTTVAAVLAVVFLALSFIANEARQDAARQAQIALARQLAAQSELARADPPRIRESLALALQATAILGAENARSFEVDAALRRSMALTPRPARAPLAGPAGTVLLAPAAAGEVATLSEQEDAGAPTLVLQRWALATGQAVAAPMRWPGTLVRPLPSQRFVVVANGAQRRVVDLQSGLVLAKLAGDDRVLAFSADGASMALASQEAVQVVETASGRPRARFEHPRDPDQGTQRWNTVYPQSAAFTEEGSQLAVGYHYSLYHKRHYGGVTVWSLAGGKVDSWLDDQPVSALQAAGGKLAWGGQRLHVSEKGSDVRLPAAGPDGLFAIDAAGDLVGTADAAGLVRLWDARSGDELWRVAGGVAVRDLRFIDDGQLLAVADAKGRLSFWPIESGALGRQALVLPADAAADSRVLAFDPVAGAMMTRVNRQNRRPPPMPAGASTEGRYTTTVQLFDSQDGRSLGPPITDPGVVDKGHFSADRRRMLTAVRLDGTRLRVWDVASAAPLAALDLGRAKVEQVHLGADGQRVLYRLGDGALWAWAWPAAPRRIGSARHLAVDEARGRIAIAAADGVRLLALDSFAQLPLRLDMPAQQSAFSPDGSVLAVEAEDGRVWVWQLATAQRVGLIESLSDTGVLQFDRSGESLAKRVNDQWLSTEWSLPALLKAGCARLEGLDPGAPASAPALETRACK